MLRRKCGASFRSGESRRSGHTSRRGRSYTETEHFSPAYSTQDSVTQHARVAAYIEAVTDVDAEYPPEQAGGKCSVSVSSAVGIVRRSRHRRLCLPTLTTVATASLRFEKGRRTGR